MSNELKHIAIPDSIIKIGKKAFSKCKKLKKVLIPSSVVSIGNNAFFKCSSLESLRIPSSVQSLGDFDFFQGSLKKIIFENPLSLKDLGLCCFSESQTILNSFISQLNINKFLSKKKMMIELFDNKIYTIPFIPNLTCLELDQKIHDFGLIKFPRIMIVPTPFSNQHTFLQKDDKIHDFINYPYSKFLITPLILC